MGDDNSIASFWKRLIAFIFDLLVINLVVIWPFQGLFARYIQKTFEQSLLIPQTGISSVVYFAVFLISIIAWLYFTFFEYYIGKTPGMALFNMEVVPLKDHLSFWKALARNCFILPFFPFYILWAIEPIYLIFYKERLTEKMTRTRTIIHIGKRYFQEYKLQKV